MLALSCQEGDVPDTITTDDGRELHLPEQVRRGLSTGRRILVCVQGDQVRHWGGGGGLGDSDELSMQFSQIRGSTLGDKCGPGLSVHCGTL